MNRSDGSSLIQRLPKYAAGFPGSDLLITLIQEEELAARKIPEGFEIGIFEGGTWWVISSQGGMLARTRF